MTEVLTFDPVFFRTYSRTVDGGKESLTDVIERVMLGFEFGPRKVPEEFLQAIREEFEAMRMLPAGRMLWVAGTPWAASPENYPGVYNCESTFLDSPGKFGLSMDFAMQGVGTGLVLEDWCVAKLPKVSTKIEVEVVGEFGAEESRSFTFVEWSPTDVVIHVGDSRKGWVVAYQQLIDLAFAIHEPRKVVVDVSAVRKRGERLKGFGGVANPTGLRHCFERVGKILTKAHGRQLTPTECCLLIDEGAKAVVAGNIRRSAGIRQFSSENAEAATIKDNLWTQTEDGWRVDPECDAFRMANHTRVFHDRPKVNEVIYLCGKAVHVW
ncbi:MAG: hypothetical protein HC771_24670 [Synechococcales cyanobacterium CRU_2_2]|nr:hypothetical protein [Synechococcales cyanobacterium CRU_2_2]